MGRLAEFLKHHGACFYDEIVEGTGLLRTRVEDALVELELAEKREAESALIKRQVGSVLLAYLG